MIKEEFSGEITEDLKKCFSNIVDQYETNKNYSKRTEENNADKEDPAVSYS